MRTLAQDALDNLIDQFARPLDFLRELVQNALDAGTPRIEVSGEYRDDHLRLTVRDFGEGMSREVINTRLTRLFASDKAGDLTQIGRFGIGFASVFALRPNAVTVETFRHGHGHRVHFDEQFQFTVEEHREPMVGTAIHIDKVMSREDADQTLREARYVLGYWCEHAAVPITFRTASAAPVADEALDPFAAFSAPAAPVDTVSRAFELDALHSVRREEDGFVVLVGVGPEPRYSFYSHGLTLISTTDPRVLAHHAERAQHLLLKVAGPGLDHTLTRDNVQHDENFERAMQVVHRARETLYDQLIERGITAAAAGEPVDPWHDAIADELAAPGGGTELPHSAPLFPLHGGGVATLDDLIPQEDELAIVLGSETDDPLTQAVRAQDYKVIALTDATQRLLLSVPRTKRFFLPRPRAVRTPLERFWLPQPRRSLGPSERALLDGLAPLTDAMGLGALHLGDFGGGSAAAGSPVAIPHPGERALVLRAGAPARTDEVLINRHHPLTRACIATIYGHDAAATQALAFAIAEVMQLPEHRIAKVLHG